VPDKRAQKNLKKISGFISETAPNGPHTGDRKSIVNGGQERCIGQERGPDSPGTANVSDDKKGTEHMTKKKDMALLIEGLRRISSDFTALADELEGKPSVNEEEKPAVTAETTEASTPEAAPEQEPVQEAPDKKEAPAEPAAPALEMSDVRKILADQSRKGYTDKVKQILSNHGASKLSELAESEYAAVVKEAEALDG
jgi:hypothetical protein